MGRKKKEDSFFASSEKKELTTCAWCGKRDKEEKVPNMSGVRSHASLVSCIRFLQERIVKLEKDANVSTTF